MRDGLRCSSASICFFAAYLGHWDNGWLFTAKGGGYEFPLFWAITCFTLTLLGDGAYALKSDVPARASLGSAAKAAA
jgi:uncharacterized membrane protein YphA (DoxX/SURF4 family)